MLERLELENYRAFEKLDLPLKKINLFFGPNNSGKSSILSSLNLLAQTMESEDLNNPLLLSGKYEDLGTYKDLVYKNLVKNDVKIKIEFLIPFEEEIKGSLELKYSYRPQRKENILSNVKIGNSVNEIVFESKYSKYLEKPIINLLYKELNKGEKTKVSKDLRFVHFIPYGFKFIDYLGKYKNKNINLDYFTAYVVNYFGQLEFIGPFRESPKRTYLFSGESPKSIGKRGEKAIDILASDYMKRGAKKKDIIKNISKWYQDCEIANDIKIKVLTDRHFEIRLSNIKSKEDENLADVGYGCSQVLPIFLSGTTLQEHSALIVEQPELHLHPRAQSGLGTFFKEFIETNTQIFVETHSEHLLLRLQSHVASGDLSPNDISIFYVFVNDEGKKEAVNLPLNDKGIFLTEWPEGFFPERLNEAKRLAKASLLRKEK